MENSYADQFTRQGYVVLKQLFGRDEVLALKREAAGIISGEKDVAKSGVFLGLTERSPLFKEAASRPALVKALQDIIGPHVIFLNDKLVFKSATTDYGSPWHQDYPYWRGSHKFSVWIALDEASKENGCLRIVPGSHLFGAVSHDGEVSDDHGFVNRLQETDIDERTVVDLPAGQGDAIIFHDLLYHASYPNNAGADRWALISTYKDGTLADPEYKWAKAAFTVAG